MRDHTALAVSRTGALRRSWLHPPGAAPRSITRRARFQELVLVVDLGELVDRARAIAFALGARDVRIVELAFEPQLRRRANGSCRS